jgi:hypothetical protein
MGGVCASAESAATPVVEAVDTKLTGGETPATPIAGDCVLKVYGARGLRNADWTWVPGSVGGVSDAYVIIKEKVAAGTETELARTKTIANCLEPLWDEEATLKFAPESTLVFTVMDKDPLKADDMLGKVEIKCADLKSGYNGELPLEDAGNGIKAFLRILAKAPGGEYPSGPPSEFSITLEKGTEKTYGFEFDKSRPENLFVTSVASTGVTKTFNDKAKPEEQMKMGQYIVAVNGATDTAKMVEELGKATTVVLSMVRPQCFTVAFDKKGSLGLTLAHAVACNCVTGINAGPVKTWNETYPDKKVEIGDRIVAVNGNRAVGAEQMKLLRNNGSMQLVFSRKAPPATIAGAVAATFWDWF